jgi:hypothetical protein
MEVIVAHLKTLLLRRATKLEPTAVCSVVSNANAVTAYTFIAQDARGERLQAKSMLCCIAGTLGRVLIALDIGGLYGTDWFTLQQDPNCTSLTSDCST